MDNNGSMKRIQKAPMSATAEVRKEALEKLHILVKSKSYSSENKYSGEGMMNYGSENIRVTKNGTNNQGTIVFYPPTSAAIQNDRNKLTQTYGIMDTRKIPLRKRNLVQQNRKLIEQITTAKTTYPRKKQLMDFQQHTNYQRMRKNLPPLPNTQGVRNMKAQSHTSTNHSNTQSENRKLQLPRLVERATPYRPLWTRRGINSSQLNIPKNPNLGPGKNQNTLQPKAQRRKSIFTKIRREIVPPESDSSEEEGEEGFLAVISYLYRERYR